MALDPVDLLVLGSARLVGGRFRPEIIMGAGCSLILIAYKIIRQKIIAWLTFYAMEP